MYKEWKYSSGVSSMCGVLASVLWWGNFSTLVSCVNGMDVLPFLLDLLFLGCS